MKRKLNKKNFANVDGFEKKPKKNVSTKDKSSKRRLTIYDDFEDENLEDFSSDYDEDEDYTND